MSTYHLNSFTIGAFRGLQGMTFERLGRFNLLIGGNNSGKTSVLEALQAFCNPEDPADWARIANARNTSSRLFSTHSLNDCLVWMFPHTKQTDTGSSGSIQLSSTGACPVREVKASVQPVFGMPDEEDLRYLAKRPLDSNPATGGTYEGIEIKLDSIRARTARRPLRSPLPAVFGKTSPLFGDALIHSRFLWPQFWDSNTVLLNAAPTSIQS